VTGREEVSVDEQVVISGERQITIDLLSMRAARLAAGLRSLGVAPGDRYAIVMRNEPAFLEASLAGAIIGAVPVPINWHWTGMDLSHVLSDCGASVAIVHTDLIQGVVQRMPSAMQIVEAPIPPEVASAFKIDVVKATGRYPTTDELIDGHNPPPPEVVTPPLAVIYTSGTTGLAKGVLRDPIEPTQMLPLYESMRELMGYEPGGVALIPAPMYHTAPNVAATFAIAAGLSVVVMPRFDPEEFLRLVDAYSVTTVQVVPTMLTRLLRLPEEVRQRYDTSSLRHVIHAAAPCPQHVKRKALDWFGPIVGEYYGGSEGGAWTYCTSEEWLAHPGTVGKPFRGVGIKILDQHLDELPPGTKGTVYGRPPAEWPSFTYLGDEQKRRDIDAGDGFITLGDIGHVDEEGYLYLSDRLNDVVIRGGVNVYPAEIEGTIMQLPGVADVAVFGVPEPDLGEAIAAHIELLPGADVTEEQVRNFVRGQLASYKTPAIIVFEESLPREDSGKLFKRRLKDRYISATEAT
jgi:long-chain acyl-CoA synthetase